jgi:Reverse transcriptase (RNA-dependent DNA polymerase)
MAWIDGLNWPRALVNVRADLIGDWYRDPWGWPEYEHVESTGWKDVAARAENQGLRKVALIDVLKENFLTRPAVVMEPIDRLVYQALVDTMSKKLIGELPEWTYGWRLPRNGPEAGAYSPNDTEWKLYRSALSANVSWNDGGLKSDIVSCFASIPIDRLTEDIVRRGGGGALTSRLLDFLDSFDNVAGRSGLLQRSRASAVLANLYLSRLDLVLRDYRVLLESNFLGIQFTFGSGGVTRWMDDIWIFGEHESTLRDAQIRLQTAARDVGLELNSGKTGVYEGDALADEALSIQHSAVDTALDEDTPDLEPLEELLDRILESPATADRSSIHFALTRLRKHPLPNRADAIIEAVPGMPHGADHLARTFRDLNWWQDHQEWYVELSRKDWVRLPWSVAGLGAMFPSRAGTVSDTVRDFFVAAILERPPLPLLALAAQRLATWDRQLARETFRAVLPSANHPAERRILGLASHLAGDERKFVRGALSEYEENRITRELIEDRGWAKVAVVPDFSAGEEG